MSKNLSEMTLEELWQLFPVFLTEHNDRWSIWYNEEYQRLNVCLSSTQARISHIGSTAIENIWAKPIIDLLVEIPIEQDLRKAKDLIVQNGYICMAEHSQSIALNKGYTVHGFAEKVYHLHLRYWGNHDELYFRDYMNDHSMAAKEYEKLKLSLWKSYEHDRDGYTNAKHEFVSEYTQRAKEIYKDRYL